MAVVPVLFMAVFTTAGRWRNKHKYQNEKLFVT